MSGIQAMPAGRTKLTQIYILMGGREVVSEGVSE